MGVRDVKIEEDTRLGVGKEPRSILLKLKDTHTQRMVVSKAKNLKHADTETSRNSIRCSEQNTKGEGNVSGVAKGTKGGKDKGETDHGDQRRDSSET